MCAEGAFGCRQLTSTSHGLAKGGFGRFAEVLPLWDALSSGTLEQLEDFGPREVATTAWSYARSGVGLDFPELFTALESTTRGRLSEFAPQGLANLAWALAKAHHAAPDFFSELELELGRPHRLADFSSSELTSIAWAYASSCEYSSHDVLDAIADEARARIRDFSLHELAVLGWSFAAADAVSAGDRLFGDHSPYARLCEAYNLDGADPGTLTQLWQWQLWRLERPETSAAWEGMSERAAATCVGALLDEGVGAPAAFEESVCRALESMGLRVSQKVRTAEGYVIDLVVEAPGRRRRVGIEVDGPQQFRGRGSRDATGSARLKRRQLRAFSELPIMSIPYWEWETLCIGDEAATLQKQTQYLTFAFAVRIGSRAKVRPAPMRSSDAGVSGAGVRDDEAGEEGARERSDRTESAPDMSASAVPLIAKTRAPLEPQSAASQSAAPFMSETSSARTYSLRAATFGESIGREEALDEAAASSLVVVGEVYAMPAVISFEQALLSRMLERGGGESRAVHLVLEHFNFRHQEWLDRFMSGEYTFNELLSQYTADGSESHELACYAPLLRLARERRDAVRLVAGFLPRPMAQVVLSDGLAAALSAAKAEGYLAEDEDGGASDAYYDFFEALITGRKLHGTIPPPQPSNLARRLFPAQVLKSAAMAHRITQLARDHPSDACKPSGASHDAYLVVCGSSHMLFGHGILERLFAAVPRLRNDCYTIVARQAAEGLVLDPPPAAQSAEPGMPQQPAAQDVPQPPEDRASVGAYDELATAFGTHTDAADLALLFEVPAKSDTQGLRA